MIGPCRSCSSPNYTLGLLIENRMDAIKSFNLWGIASNCGTFIDFTIITNTIIINASRLPVPGNAAFLRFPLSDHKQCRQLGRFPIDRSTVSTFEISLCFKEDSFRSRLWPLRTLLMLLHGRRQTASVSAAAAAAKEDAVDARQHTAAVDHDEDFATRFTGGLVIDKFVEIHKKKYFRNLR